MKKLKFGNARKVLDVSGKSKILKNNILNDVSNIEGELELKIYFEAEDKMGLNVKTVTVPFISKLTASSQLHAIVNTLEFDLNNGNVIVQGNISIVESNFQRQKINIVQDVTKKELSNEKDYSMIVYSIKPNDTLWDVSKKFRVKQENIISSNNLEDPYVLKSGEKMYIVR